MIVILIAGITFRDDFIKRFGLSGLLRENNYQRQVKGFHIAIVFEIMPKNETGLSAHLKLCFTSLTNTSTSKEKVSFTTNPFPSFSTATQSWTKVQSLTT